ncbi:MAG: dienelactone hydrolase family protein [Desulfovibrio sp.]|nr:dienelactone hydrolase family protein [Desulfovibrio sp.]
MRDLFFAALPKHGFFHSCPSFFPAACRLFFCVALLGAFPCFPSRGGMTSIWYSVGMRTFGVWEPDVGERFDFSVWYPGTVSQTERVREGWIVEASKRGRIIPGFYPVILISHDTSSDRFANNDVAASLASGGFIVISPTHMGDNQNDSADLYTARLLRARPRHLLRALETVLDSPEFAPYTDESRIGLLGVGFGGITALQLAGAIPDPSLFTRHCAGAPVTDAFCAPWAAQRLLHLVSEMHLTIEREGRRAFAPYLDLYAPELMPAPAVLLSSERAKPEQKGKGRSLLTRFFSKSPDNEEAAADTEESPVAAPLTGNSTGAVVTYTPALDFQGGHLFGGTDSGESFVDIALQDSPQFRNVTTENSTGFPSSPDAFSTKASGPLAHRRSPDARKIRGIALMAPAGGMLFSREALSGVQLPVALIEAGQDTVYPPRTHSRPLHGSLPIPPELLFLAAADHFSLFARCSKDTMTNLGEACGRLIGDERNAVAEQRNRFLLSFFHSVLGVPQPPPPPSGFVAAQHTQ